MREEWASHRRVTLKKGEKTMKNETITVDAVAFTAETFNLNEVETMEESFAASGSSNSGHSS